MSGLEVDVSLSPFDISSPDFGLLVGCDSPEARLPEAWGREGLRVRQRGEAFQQLVFNCRDSVEIHCL